MHFRQLHGLIWAKRKKKSSSVPACLKPIDWTLLIGRVLQQMPTLILMWSTYPHNLQGPPKLHALVNNAGANFMGIPPWYTEQGVAGMSQVSCFHNIYTAVVHSKFHGHPSVVYRARSCRDVSGKLLPQYLHCCRCIPKFMGIPPWYTEQGVARNSQVSCFHDIYTAGAAAFQFF